MSIVAYLFMDFPDPDPALDPDPNSGSDSEFAGEQVPVDRYCPCMRKLDLSARAFVRTSRCYCS